MLLRFTLPEALDACREKISIGTSPRFGSDHIIEIMGFDSDKPIITGPLVVEPETEGED